MVGIFIKRNFAFGNSGTLHNSNEFLKVFCFDSTYSNPQYIEFMQFFIPT